MRRGRGPLHVQRRASRIPRAQRGREGRQVEKIMCVPMSAGLIVKYDPEKDDVFLCLYDVAMLDM